MELVGGCVSIAWLLIPLHDVATIQAKKAGSIGSGDHAFYSDDADIVVKSGNTTQVTFTADEFSDVFNIEPGNKKNTVYLYGDHFADSLDLKSGKIKRLFKGDYPLVSPNQKSVAGAYGTDFNHFAVSTTSDADYVYAADTRSWTKLSRSAGGTLIGYVPAS